MNVSNFTNTGGPMTNSSINEYAQNKIFFDNSVINKINQETNGILIGKRMGFDNKIDDRNSTINNDNKFNSETYNNNINYIKDYESNYNKNINNNLNTNTKSNQNFIPNRNFKHLQKDRNYFSNKNDEKIGNDNYINNTNTDINEKDFNQKGN
jgi:hypothetical protein